MDAGIGNRWGRRLTHCFILKAIFPRNPVNGKINTMNCIDAIEGSFKHLIHKIHQAYQEEIQDDTAYIRNIRAIMDAVDDFLQAQPELMMNDPRILKWILYDYSKKIWMGTIPNQNDQESDALMVLDREEYQQYYFDYIYHNGVYPP